MPPELQQPFFIAATTLVGLMVGSFLNVAIHRLPLEGQSVGNPRRSRCPKCGHALSWYENIPVLSWLLLRARCSGCKTPISMRYPLVELLTAGLWYLAASRLPLEQWDLIAVHILVLSGLIVATFVDFDCFEIPDEISKGGMWLAPVLSLAVPSLHDSTLIAQRMSSNWEPGLPVDRLGALFGCLAGMAVGGGVLIAVGWIGSKLYGRDAMGFGDVKLLAAGGGFIGPGGALAAMMLGSVAASVAGLGNMLRFYCLSRSRTKKRGIEKSRAASVRLARIVGRYIPFGPYLGIGIGIVLLAWNDVRQLIQWSH